MQLTLSFPSVVSQGFAFLNDDFLLRCLACREHEARHGLLSRDPRTDDPIADLLFRGPFGVRTGQHS